MNKESPLDDKDNNLQGMLPKKFKSIYTWLPNHIAYFFNAKKTSTLA
jgi:hypothetical protein